MSPADHDPELDAFLQRRSVLHRRLADLDHAEPPAELDRIVLSRARQAIEVRSGPPLYRSFRWAMPVGLAATILIAFALVLNVAREPRPVTGSHEESLAFRASSDLAGSAVIENAEPPAPASPRPAPVAAEVQGFSKAQVQVSARAADAPAAAPGEPRPAISPRAAQAADGRDAAAPRVAAQESARAPATAVAADSAAKPAPPTAYARTVRDADAWLREIARLRAEGKTAEAERELAAFRQAHPGHSGGASLAAPPAR